MGAPEFRRLWPVGAPVTVNTRPVADSMRTFEGAPELNGRYMSEFIELREFVSLHDTAKELAGIVAKTANRAMTAAASTRYHFMRRAPYISATRCGDPMHAITRSCTRVE